MNHHGWSAISVQHGYRSTPIDITLAGNQADTVTVGVLNRGPAIPEWQRRSIFDPLTRGVDPEAEADADQRTSLGLGLYIAHEIASAHGGTIDVVSSELAGTTFRFVLPRHLPNLRVN